jgi:serine/threonine protein kinase
LFIDSEVPAGRSGGPSPPALLLSSREWERWLEVCPEGHLALNPESGLNAPRQGQKAYSLAFQRQVRGPSFLPKSCRSVSRATVSALSPAPAECSGEVESLLDLATSSIESARVPVRIRSKPMATRSSSSRFEIRGSLGRGASGSVDLAWDRELSREVALKRIPLCDTTNSMLEEEQNGAILQQRLARISQQVPEVFAFDEDQEFFWIAMEYVHGVDLSTALAHRPLPERRAVQIAIQLCDCLVKIHEFTDKIGGRKILGVVHGDIKPKNIRLEDNDRVRVIDFGIAKQLSLGRTYTRSFFGTTPYTPREQLISGVATKASDLWAVAVVLYEMISGHLPVEGNIGEMNRQILEGNLHPLPQTCSPDLRWIINTSLKKDPEFRYPTAEELGNDLRKFLNGTFTRSSGADRSHETTRERGRWQDADQTPELPRQAASPNRVEQAPSNRGQGAAPPNRVESVQPSHGQRVSRADTQESLPNVSPRIDPEPVRPKRRFRLVISISFILLALLCLPPTYVWWKAERIRKDILVDPSGVEKSWREYQDLQKLDLLGIARRKVRADMKIALTSAADLILNRYAEDAPRVDRQEWERALRYLKAVRELGYSDNKTQAKIFYCMGHLNLADSKISEDNSNNATEKRQAAISDLWQAAELDPSWPDPHVSLARIYGYEQVDLDKMDIEIQAAKNRGYHNVRRLIAYQADTYRNYGWNLSKQSLKTPGIARKRELLEEAIRRLDQSIELYKDIPGYAKSERNLGEAEEWKEISQRRLNRLPPLNPISTTSPDLVSPAGQ